MWLPTCPVYRDVCMYMLLAPVETQCQPCPAVAIFWPKVRSTHPENYLFSLSKKMFFSGSKYLKNILFNFEKRSTVVELIYTLFDYWQQYMWWCGPKLKKIHRTRISLYGKQVFNVCDVLRHTFLDALIQHASSCLAVSAEQSALKHISATLYWLAWTYLASYV